VFEEALKNWEENQHLVVVPEVTEDQDEEEKIQSEPISVPSLSDLLNKLDLLKENDGKQLYEVWINSLIVFRFWCEYHCICTQTK
jgi:hypothetical protein